MSRLSILVTARFDLEQIKRLEGRAEVLLRDWWEAGRRMSPEELASNLRGRQVLVTEVDSVNEALLEQCPDLKVVITCRGNPVNLDIPACTRRGVLALNTPGRNADAVADMAIAFILACARHLTTAHHMLKGGGWTRADQGTVLRRFEGRDMGDATVGLVGFGAVGRAVARRLRGFGTRALAYDPYVPPEAVRQAGATPANLPTLLRESDFVSLHVHVTKETANMIGEAQFALMKPTAYLINTARAGVVNQEAMLRALRQQRIAGAALDVFTEEPLPLDSPLRSLDNVILTPHIAGATPGVVKVQARTVVEQLEALLEGREPPHMLNPQVASAALQALQGR